ncbi:MAG: SCO family protein [Acidimicrobiales bacterium]
MSQRSIDLTNPFVVALFRHTSLVTMTIWIGIVAVAILITAAALGGISRFNLSSAGLGEPRSRTYLRVGFGLLWLVDGFLQFQASMPLGLANNVVAPMSRGTPSALRTLIGHAVNLWNSHPITLASGVAWLEIGLGVLLLVSNGVTGRVAGAASALWAALVWLVGDGAGGLFVHGATILFAWPGAALVYGYAGAWLALNPERFRRSFPLVTRRSVAVVLALGAVEQALPAAGFWHGGATNALSEMANYMAAIAQPRWLAAIVRGVGTLAATMGGGLNVAILLWLVVSAVGLWFTRATARRWPVYSVIAGCLVLWVVAQDTALFGGLSTDLNTMPALAVVLWCASPTQRDMPITPRGLSRDLLSNTGSVVAAFAAAIVLVASVAMGAATVSGAETTLFLADNGPATAVNALAKPFTLTDQFAQRYALGEHHGRLTLLTFLDPNCLTSCVSLASQIAQVRQGLAANAKLDIVAVAVDPYHESLSDVRRYIHVKGLGRVADFYFVTGSRAALRFVWRVYGISVVMKASNQTSVHTNVVFLVAANGRLHWIIPDNPVSSAAGTASAVAQLRRLLAYEGVH